MPTHAIGPNTRNMVTNVPDAWGVIIGREAMRRNVSAGEFVRRYLIKGIQEDYPEMAAELLAEINRHKAMVRQAAVKAGSAVLLAIVVLAGGNDTVRALRGGRRRDEITVSQWEEAV